jgi:hypothetical protein
MWIELEVKTDGMDCFVVIIKVEIPAKNMQE